MVLVKVPAWPQSMENVKSPLKPSGPPSTFLMILRSPGAGVAVTVAVSVSASVCVLSPVAMLVVVPVTAVAE